ncbi:MAG: arylsulfatase, partial [Phycisphaerales bacterium JB038]
MKLKQTAPLLAGLAGVASLSASAIGAGRAASAQAPSPNIVFIMADDLGIGDLGCYNADSRIPTPHLDALAADGMRFTDAHTSSAVCTPTRYGVLTGRYCWRSSLKRWVLGGESPALIEKDRLTVAGLLQQHSYTTGAVGKWHLGLDWTRYTDAKGKERIDYSKPITFGPRQLGFDYSYIFPASLDMAPYCWVEGDRVVEEPIGRDVGSKRRWSGGGGFWRGGAISPSFRHDQVLPIIGEKACDFIERQADNGPFFLYVPLTAPHTPWLPTEEFQGVTAVSWYGDFVAQVDAVMGEIVEAIDEAGVGRNTLIILTSDNGSHWPLAQIEFYGHRANAHYRGQKADIHEAGHRVPYLVRWPGRVPAGTVCDETIGLHDLMATCAGVLGVALPDDAGEDSVNLLPAMLGKTRGAPLREAIVHHSGDGMFAIRQGDWKLILGRGSGGFTKPARI